jgi:hypothetical protein
MRQISCVGPIVAAVPSSCSVTSLPSATTLAFGASVDAGQEGYNLFTSATLSAGKTLQPLERKQCSRVRTPTSGTLVDAPRNGLATTSLAARKEISR